jgi:hypothetical protein
MAPQKQEKPAPHEPAFYFALMFNPPELFDSLQNKCSSEIARGLISSRRVLLPRGFNARQYAGSQQYNRTNDYPVRGQMQQKCAVNQADD